MNYIPIHKIDEDYEYWENGDWKDVNNMMIKSISKMVKDFNKNNLQFV